MKRVLSWSALVLVSLGAAALAQDGSTLKTVAPKAANPVPAAAVPAPDATTEPPAPPPAPPQGGTELTMRGLDKITGRPTSIAAPIGKPVHFATLTITARYCYSTPPSETPETTAFVQVEDHRPDQPGRRVFSGWMYASSPGLNALEHPLYDVWVISCNNAPASAVAANTSTAPVKVKAPDSSDKEGIQALPEGAGQ
ncbi:MAG TPA: DUF2155 domain-containing protein [Rhizomicrobium sp.]|nr:DUF2155 domain-containing protein [Rhizomicrobium sp.]